MTSNVLINAFRTAVNKSEVLFADIRACNCIFSCPFLVNSYWFDKKEESPNSVQAQVLYKKN